MASQSEACPAPSERKARIYLRSSTVALHAGRAADEQVAELQGRSYDDSQSSGPTGVSGSARW